MKTVILLGGLIGSAPVAGYGQSPENDSQSLTPLPFNEVVLKDNFWKPRLQTQVETLVPYYAWDNRGDGSMMVWFLAD